MKEYERNREALRRHGADRIHFPFLDLDCHLDKKAPFAALPMFPID